MYCILKGFSLYNFGNKIVLIVIVFIVNIRSCVENECKWMQMLTLLIERTPSFAPLGQHVTNN